MNLNPLIILGTFALSQHPRAVSRVFYGRLAHIRSATMKTAKTLTSLLFLSAMSIAPAHANWFSNPRTNMMMNIGSAPNPTPADLRGIGDSTRPVYSSAGREGLVLSERVAYVDRDNSGAAMRAKFDRMQGKMVFGAHGARLGTILTINTANRMADVQTPGGVAVSVPVGLLMEKGGRVTAPTISHSDMKAMAKTQTGHTVSINIDQRHPARASRG
jgi:hypothetical protein